MKLYRFLVQVPMSSKNLQKSPWRKKVIRIYVESINDKYLEGRSEKENSIAGITDAANALNWELTATCIPQDLFIGFL